LRKQRQPCGTLKKLWHRFPFKPAERRPSNPTRCRFVGGRVQYRFWISGNQSVPGSSEHAGTEVNMQECPRCGSRFPDTENFCDMDGSQLAEVEEQEEEDIEIKYSPADPERLCLQARIVLRTLIEYKPQPSNVAVCLALLKIGGMN
jgi:hypothetical protein